MLIWLGKQRLNQRDSIETAPQNDREIAIALASIHSFDIEGMQSKIQQLEGEVRNYEEKQISQQDC